MSTENNYRLSEDTCNCLWCKHASINSKEVLLDCKKTNKKVNKNYTCDLWRYGF
jgi:hypothetical protein